MDVAEHESGLLSRFPAVRRWLLSVDDYHRMGEAGILTEDNRVELIDGELVATAPIGSEHAGTVGGLNRLLLLAVGDRALVWPQNPLRLDRRSESQPDFSVLKPRSDGYRGALPTPADVLLVVEVADSSIAYDRGAKLALYARSGIGEVWIVDLTGGAIEVHRAPEGEGFRWSSRFGPGDTLEIAALPGARIAVADVLG